jgi:hypothetical protein
MVCELLQAGQGEFMLVLLSPIYWDKKIKIAILTVATFIALC